MIKKQQKSFRWAKSLGILALTIVCFLFFLLGALQSGVAYRKAEKSHWSPDYAQENIMPLLIKEERTEEEYDILYAQTGLTKLGIDGLLAQGNIARILTIQEAYFQEYVVKTDSFAPYTYTQKINGQTEFAVLENGDIFISGSAFTSWFRYGHSGLVVDGGKEFVLDSVRFGRDSALSSIQEFKNHSRFMILRPNLDAETRSAVAKYALENLRGKPYDVTVGVLSPKANENISGTHCAHLVWYAYQRFGIDLDSTAGLIVTPRDLANSPKLQLVQSFGFPPERLWR